MTEAAMHLSSKPCRAAPKHTYGKAMAIDQHDPWTLCSSEAVSSLVAISIAVMEVRANRAQLPYSKLMGY